MNVFIKTTQARDQEQLELREHPIKARIPETYYGKSHINCYHFCQQCEDYFKTPGAIGINCTPFAITFFHGSISLRWAQHKRRHKRPTPITWSKFKAFLQKYLGSSQAFIDSIWSKFRRNSQFQLEETRDWASHFQHLQSILSEFDPIWTPNKLTMICYFRENLKPSIKVEMEQQNREFMNFEEMVQRAVNVKVKAGLRSSILIWDSDARCPQGHRPSHNTSSKVQIQETAAKELRTKKSKPKEVKLTNSKTPAPPRFNKLAKPNCKKKRRQWLKKKKDSLVTGNNAIEGKKKQTPGNTSQVTYYNCQKKGHFANKCTKPPKN